MLNRDALANLARMYPYRDGLYMYTGRSTGSTSAATLYTYLRSNEGTYFIHETLFKLKRGEVRTPREWLLWIQKYVFAGTGSNDDEPAKRDGIMRGAVLPGIERRTGKLWSIDRVIGYTTHDIQQSYRTKVDTRRHQAKCKRRSS